MGVSLYRQGDSHTVRGVPCELCVFPVEELEYRLQEGWVTDPVDAYDTPDPEPEPVVELDNNVAEIDLSTMSNPEIRGLARLQDHPKWDTARIDTLKRFLDNGTDTEE